MLDSADSRTACPHLCKAHGLAPLIRAHADEAEELRHLPAAVASALAQAGLYRLAADRQIRGAEAAPTTQIRVIEAVSRADGSAGWNLMIGIETFGLVAPGCKGRCEELLADPLTIMASSTAAVGRAQRVAGGWRVSGQWQFVSGIHNAHVYLAERCWRKLLADKEATRDETLLQIVACDAARAAVEVVETLCEAAGTSANRVGEPLERIARDVRVVRQHTTVAPHVLEDAGRALLDLHEPHPMG